MSSAGELFVSILGDSSKLDTTLKQIPAQAGAAGRASGSQFSSAFQSSFQGVSGKIGKSLGMGMADQMTRGFADALRGDKSISVAFTDLIKGIPIIGAVAALVEGGIGAAMGTFDAEKDAAVAAISAAKMATEADRRIANVKAIAAIEAQIKENTERAAGNEKDAAQTKLRAIEAAEAALRNNAVIEGQNGNIRKKEFDQIQDLSHLRIELARQAYALEIKRIDDLAQKQIEADALVAKKEAEELIRNERRMKKEDSEARREAIDSVNREFASIAIGESNTALGSFKFEAFPPDMQKMIQLRIAAAVEKLANQRMEAAGVY
jgi:hypothetical protein